MGIEDEYRSSTRHLGPLFLLALAALVAFLFHLSCSRGADEAVDSAQAPHTLLERPAPGREATNA